MKTFLCVLLTLLCSSVYAGQELIKTVLTTSNPWEISQINSFINEAEKKLPPVVKQVLLQNAPIQLSFNDLSNAKTDISYLANICRSANTKAYDEVGFGEFGLAYHKQFLIRNKPAIELDNLLYIEILKGPNNSFNYNCNHRNGYRLALATFLHELFHIYDHQANLSNDRRFLHLMTFKKFGFLTSQKNRENFRSLTPYEMVSPKEALAVNFEYFILDPEYRCRRPALYEYFAEKLKVRPLMSKSCNLNTNVIVQGISNRLMNLNPHNLYRVDYLLADAGGAAVESKLGHSMLRLVFCEAGKPKSQACVSNVLNHVVVSFRANSIDNRDQTMDFDKSPKFELWKNLKNIWGQIDYKLRGVGIGENFPSDMFLLSIPQIVSEYNNYDYRDLKSVPLDLTETEKRDLVYRVLEIKWGYSGSYNFLTNNCKTETEDLLKAVVRNPQIEKISAISPVGLRESFYESNLVSSADGNKELTHKSLREYLLKAIEGLREIVKTENLQVTNSKLLVFILKENFAKVETMKKYIKTISADERRLFILGIKNKFEIQNERLYRQIMSKLLSLEIISSLFQKMDLFVMETGLGVHLEKSPQIFKDSLDPSDYQKLTDRLNIKKSRSAHIESIEQKANKIGGYGIPMHKDWGISDSLGISTEDGVLKQHIDKIVVDALSEERINLDTTEATIRLIADLLYSHLKSQSIPAAPM